MWGRRRGGQGQGTRWARKRDSLPSVAARQRGGARVCLGGGDRSGRRGRQPSNAPALAVGPGGRSKGLSATPSRHRDPVCQRALARRAGMVDPHPAGTQPAPRTRGPRARRRPGGARVGRPPAPSPTRVVPLQAPPTTTQPRGGENPSATIYVAEVPAQGRRAKKTVAGRQNSPQAVWAAAPCSSRQPPPIQGRRAAARHPITGRKIEWRLLLPSLVTPPSPHCRHRPSRQVAPLCCSSNQDLLEVQRLSSRLHWRGGGTRDNLLESMRKCSFGHQWSSFASFSAQRYTSCMTPRL